MSRENVEKVRSSLAGWNRGDVEAWLESAHPEIEWSSEIARQLEGPERVFRGTVQMRQYWEEWHSLWDVTIEISEVRDLGDTVLALGRTRTHVEASGIDLEQPVAYVFEFDRGLARNVRAYLDPHQALEAVGLAEEAMSQENVEIVRRGLEAQTREDWATALDTLHADAEIHDFDIPDAGVYHGHDGYLAWIARWDEGWDSWRIDDVEIRAAGDDHVIALFRIIATGGASGIEVDRPDAVVYRLAGGKIVRMEYFNDQRQALAAVGLAE